MLKGIEFRRELPQETRELNDKLDYKPIRGRQMELKEPREGGKEPEDSLGQIAVRSILKSFGQKERPAVSSLLEIGTPLGRLA